MLKMFSTFWLLHNKDGKSHTFSIRVIILNGKPDMSSTYKQTIKDRSRRMLWQHAVETLTTKRSESRILSETYTRSLWNYCFDEFLQRYQMIQSYNPQRYEEWLQFANDVYETKRPADLRVGYFAGPEPENDLTILLELGVRIENISAFELDAGMYKEALTKVVQQHPGLKLFPGSIDHYLASDPKPFDILYLDFTAPLFSQAGRPFATIHKVFEAQALTDLSALIVNTCEPDNNPETIEFLTSYFQCQPYVEGTVLGVSTDDGEPVDWFIEGPLVWPIERVEIQERVQSNASAAYSAFATQYPLLYANMVQPAFRALCNGTVKRRLFAAEGNPVDVGLKLITAPSWLAEEEQEEETEEPLGEWGAGGDLIMSPTEYPLWHFLRDLKELDHRIAQSWTQTYNIRDGSATRLDAVQMGDMFRSVLEGYWPILSSSLRNALPAIQQALPDAVTCLFCDAPLPHLWIELALNQIGHPYHANIDQHFRLGYQAKKRRMMADVFILDRCPSLYDWLPFTENYATFLAVPEQQMLCSIGMNAIHRQSRWILPRIYTASNLICVNERPWARWAELKPRVWLVDEQA